MIACLWVFAHSALAQDAPGIRNFTPSHYGAQNQNWGLAQSPEGWIYVANNGCLLEFDGARWQQFLLPEKQTVRTVMVGLDGAIFCGGFAEFGYWKPNASGQMEYHSLSGQIQAGLLGKEEIWHILVAPSYVLFQSFSAIYKYDYHKVTVVRPPNSIMFAREVNGKVLLPVIGRGLYELLPDDTFRFIENTEVLSDKIVQFLVSDGQGGIWAGTTNHGIFEIKDGRCVPWSNPLNDAFRKYQLNKALRLRDGGWVIGTILNGAYVLDKTGSLRFGLYRENGLQNNTVLAMLEDRDGNLWLGLDRGVDFVTLRSPLTIFADQTGSIGTTYTAAVADGALYIGTNQGVFIRPGGRNDFALVEGTQGQVWQLQNFDRNLICGHNGGTFVIANGQARKISEVTGGWCTVPVPGRSGVLLQSTYTGLLIFRKDAGQNWAFAFRVDSFAEPLKKIIFDPQGYVWGVHPNKGLFRLSLSDDLKKVEKVQAFGRTDGLPTDFRLDLAQPVGRLVVNTAQGPFEIDPEQTAPRFRPFTPSFGRSKLLPGRNAEFFAIDSTGIRLIAGEESYALPLSLVPSFENIVALSDDRYLFCLENGFAMLDRRQLTLNKDAGAPGASIRVVATASGESFLPAGQLAFSWRQNSLVFRFASAFYERSPKFSWQLEGFISQWSPWQTNPEKEFTNLPPGKYTFRVRTDLGGPEARVVFRIAPPWYLSRWAVGLYAGIALALFWGIEHFNRYRLEKQRRRLMEEKQRDLTRQRDEAEREKLLLEVENKNRELSNAALNLIRKNEVLQRLKDELVDANNEPRALQKIVRLINEHLEGDHDWEIFEESFNRVHDDFFKRLMHDFPDLTPGDLRLAAYLKMNLASKEIAPLLNISVRGVENKRYRLRKKLGLSEEANLTEFIMNF